MFSESQPLHFAGIGGIGMSGLAEIYHARGCTVTGSDVKLSAITARLERLGIRVCEGHAAANLPSNTAALIVTSALRPDNPEMVEARRRGLPVVLRGELLADLMSGRKGVAVGGSHGKTTTTSMLACIALEAGVDPTVFIGTLVPFLDGSNVRLGGDLMITECDESDGSFLELAPAYSIVTNIDREHLDHYGTFENAKQAFVRFANRVSFRGAAILCVDDPEVRSVLPAIRRRVVTYGISSDAHLRLSEVITGTAGSHFHLTVGGEALGTFELNVLGRHNVLNATAAIAAALELGIPLEQIRAGLAAYRGTGRRMELKGTERGITVMDDYGHHPTEVRATLAALRLTQPGRLVVLFQPHRYTRTKALMPEFASAFGDADVVRIVELYEASESPIEGVNSEALAKAVRQQGHPDCRFAGSLAQSVEAIAGELRAGDLVLTLGAGSVTQAGPMLLAKLRKESSDG
ncbi:UDP-N-acetylmuramate--L-alanine ligase [Paludibaculum fermentans]|uniref:UDP-N-acetylmuramate--L-alanine ligase n=1 Tax=Paludibaculum fermentans TaxID=1473598 RepID=A0A7S7SPH9_PALFE|nr:UDP-N-acetylmuramate--L-alanine ligase [Paludibaculum fermentans]QOY91626.1 UDP-N-acetylmuramate--L-alanine ligase [Paludibaculum fermentans]